MTSLAERSQTPNANLYNWDKVRADANRIMGKKWSSKLTSSAVEDFVQEAIIVTQERMANGEVIDNPSKFVNAAASRRLSNEYRDLHIKNRKEFDANKLEAAPSSQKSTEQQVIEKITGERIIECILLLPQQQREVFTMHYIDDLTYAEIAAILGVTKSTVATQIARARVKVRSMMGAE